MSLVLHYSFLPEAAHSALSTPACQQLHLLRASLHALCQNDITCLVACVPQLREA